MKALFKRALTALTGSARAMYEAGRRFSGGARSIIRAWYQDARFDADQASRSEIARKARYFEANNAIVNRLADLFEEYTVGASGIVVIPSSTDEAWNQIVANEWKQWQQRCDFNGQLSFEAMQSLCARAWFVDGEAFALKTHDYGLPAEPRLQLFEGHRISGPGGLNAHGSPEGINLAHHVSRIIDGVEVDELGRPAAYWINSGFESNTFRRYPVSDVSHLWEASRIGQVRGLSFLYPVLNDIHDLDDLQILEMRAAKAAAEITTVIYNQSGEIEPTQFTDIQRKRFSGDEPQSPDADPQERAKFYADAIGGRTVSCYRGDKVEQFKSERPSVATQGYWDHLIGKICVGVGMSKLLVFPHSMQGTVVRADLDTTDAFFRARSKVIQDWVVSIYHWWLEWAIQNRPTLRNPPRDYRRVITRPPRSVKVDVGYDSAAELAALAAGATTYEAIFTPRGMDWRDAFRQSAREAKFIEDLAAEMGVSPQAIATKAYKAASKPQVEGVTA